MGNIYLKIGNAALAHINLAFTPRYCNVYSHPKSPFTLPNKNPPLTPNKNSPLGPKQKILEPPLLLVLQTQHSPACSTGYPSIPLKSETRLKWLVTSAPQTSHDQRTSSSISTAANSPSRTQYLNQLSTKLTKQQSVFGRDLTCGTFVRQGHSFFKRLKIGLEQCNEM